MRILFTGLIIGAIIGFGGGLFTDGVFHPDFFVLSTLLSFIVILSVEIKKTEKNEAHSRNVDAKKAS